MTRKDGPGLLEALALGVALIVALTLGVVVLRMGPSRVPLGGSASPWLLALVLVSVCVTIVVVVQDRWASGKAGADDFRGGEALQSGERWFDSASASASAPGGPGDQSR